MKAATFVISILIVSMAVSLRYADRHHPEPNGGRK
jgi:hypothetical protein